MGRMKELFIKQREEEAYNELYAYITRKNDPTNLDIQCPNCNNTTLLFKSVDDIKCLSQGCGHEFVLINANTVRFK